MKELSRVTRERLEIEDKSFHSLRHYFSCTKYNKFDKEGPAMKLAASLSLEEIASLLGHQNKNTTKSYLH
jgi:integrase